MAVIDTHHPAPDAATIAAVRAKVPEDLYEVLGFAPYDGLNRSRGRVETVRRTAQFPTD